MVPSHFATFAYATTRHYMYSGMLFHLVATNLLHQFCWGSSNVLYGRSQTARFSSHLVWEASTCQFGLKTRFLVLTHVPTLYKLQSKYIPLTSFDRALRFWGTQKFFWDLGGAGTVALLHPSVEPLSVFAFPDKLPILRNFLKCTLKYAIILLRTA